MKKLNLAALSKVSGGTKSYCPPPAQPACPPPAPAPACQPVRSSCCCCS